MALVLQQVIPIASKGIDKGDSGFGNMPNIAGCEGKAMLQRRRRELAVLDRNGGMERHNPSPLVGTVLIER